MRSIKRKYHLMKFGKLSDIENIDFRLPQDSAASERVLSALDKEAKESSMLYIGCTGWSMKEWLGKVYPKSCKPSDYLYHYSRQFNTIELNTTHYRIPDAKTIEKWKSESAEDFKFCPKIPQVISHSRDLGFGTGKVIEFCDQIQGLAEKLGCCFMQLPPYFGLEHIVVLKHFLDNYPSGIPLAIEFRHPDWFKGLAQAEEVFDLLEQKNITMVITDVAGRRDVLHQRLTTSTAMIRFVGNGLHPTDYTRIDEWIKKLGEWVKAGIQDLYFFTHEPDNILAPDLAGYMHQQVQKQLPAIPVRGPKLADPLEGKQISLF